HDIHAAGHSSLGPDRSKKRIRRSIFSIWKQIQPDTSAPPNRIAASRFASLGWLDVVNTSTLEEIP
ncbi:hypothetical protein, partial [Cohnella sp. WQ 127256]|uniref:hypothetical protein n=1 Tax=Cohnella sp. WQ 127256 TaxID=2938790 RepID=UPI00211847FB